MTAALRPQISACPACLAAPAAEALAARAAAPVRGDVVLSLPGIHCAACISGVEHHLTEIPGVHGARVNLTKKRVTIDTDGTLEPADLVSVLTAAGYEAHELDATALSATQTDQAGRNLLMRLAVAGFAAMNVMLLSVAVWSGAEGITRDTFHWISAAITLPTVAFAGQPFYRNAWAALRVGKLNMDVPITLAIGLAVVTSVWEVTLSGEHAYFDAALALTFFLLTGRYLDYRTRSAARSAAQELAALEVPRAWRLTGQKEEHVAVSALGIGDLIRVRPGGRMPVDGIIRDGQSELDTSALTGETLPVYIKPGAQVTAGAVNLTGPLVVETTAVGRDSALGRMADLVAVAEAGRSRYTSLADRAAKLYAPGVHILSALAFVGWYLATWDLRTALNIAAAVLIITCPCALGLAVPAVTTAASGRLFRQGLLIKNATALERLAQIDTVVFDKTGTLTEGRPELDNLDGFTRDELAIAAGLAQGSAHPLSQAIFATAQAQGVTPAKLRGLHEVPGHGSEALWKDTVVRLGRASWAGGGASRQTAAWLQIGRAPARPFLFQDRLRSGAADTVADLQAAGMTVLLMSGDTAQTVEAMAHRLGVSQWASDCLPEDKVARIAALRDQGHKVLMVGDGLNDTAALTAAHASISPASALDAARVASDVVLLGSDLRPIADALATARKATRRIKENFQIATWYNIIAVPLAIAGLCSPLIAALAMSTSSLTVSLNALRLR